MPASSGLIHQPSEGNGGAVMDPIQQPTDSASSSRTNSEINLTVATVTVTATVTPVFSSEAEGNTFKTSHSWPDLASTNSQKKDTYLLKRTSSISSSSHEPRKRCNEQPQDDWETDIVHKLNTGLHTALAPPPVMEELPKPLRENQMATTVTRGKYYF